MVCSVDSVKHSTKGVESKFDLGFFLYHFPFHSRGEPNPYSVTSIFDLIWQLKKYCIKIQAQTLKVSTIDIFSPQNCYFFEHNRQYAK